MISAWDAVGVFLGLGNILIASYFMAKNEFRVDRFLAFIIGCAILFVVFT